MTYFFENGNNKNRKQGKGCEKNHENTSRYKSGQAGTGKRKREAEKRDCEGLWQVCEILYSAAKVRFQQPAGVFDRGSFMCGSPVGAEHSPAAGDAATMVTVGLIMMAQLLTGFGVFDVIAKFAGAGVIVPITGFSNAMVAPAIEYKKEGPVLGAGAKMFSVAGPVLVCGISSAVCVGVLFRIIYLL